MEVVLKFAEKHNIDMPLFKCIYEMTHGTMTQEQAMQYLMLRELTSEYFDDFDDK